MRIAIIGAGISGLVAAYLLNREHEITVFEANGYVGGHTNTIPIECNGTTYQVDTGFIVFNERTYPSFIELLRRLEVPSHRTEMSCSVRCENTGLEYNGASLRKVYIQPRNLLRPSFHRMVLEILRFYREAPAFLAAGGGEQPPEEGKPDRPASLPRRRRGGGPVGCEARSDIELTLGEFLQRGRYSKSFIEQHIIPMGAAIWSTPPRQMLDFPARSFVRFMANHGFLQVADRPQWRVVTGGSQRYVERLLRSFEDRIRRNCAVESVARGRDQARLRLRNGETADFDAVVFATHSDQALRLLADPTDDEREILAAIPYQRNDVVLHTDTSLLPRDRRAWASWNYHILKDDPGAVAVTYNMNILQGLDAPEQFCVTLNRPDVVDPRRVLRKITYHHPVLTTAGIAAQRRVREINGRNRTYFCGAYWGYGFHEDGVRSGLAVGECFGQRLDGPIHAAAQSGVEAPIDLPPSFAPPEDIRDRVDFQC